MLGRSSSLVPTRPTDPKNHADCVPITPDGKMGAKGGKRGAFNEGAAPLTPASAAPQNFGRRGLVRGPRSTCVGARQEINHPEVSSAKIASFLRHMSHRGCRVSMPRCDGVIEPKQGFQMSHWSPPGSMSVARSATSPTENVQSGSTSRTIAPFLLIN